MSNWFRHLDTLAIWILDKCWLPFQSIPMLTSRLILVLRKKYMAYEKRSLILSLNIAQLIDASSVKKINFKSLTLKKLHSTNIQAVKIQRSQHLSRQIRSFRFLYWNCRRLFGSNTWDQWDCVLIAFDNLSTKEGKTCSSSGIGLPKQYLCKQ